MAKKEFEYEFNPIKEQKGNEQAQSVVWSTKSIEAAVDAIKKGLPLKVNPFIGNNTKLLKPELVFKRTEEEINDYIHCMQDVTYFAEKCFVMTPEGLQPIHLREYQFEYLKHLQENRFSIFLACRQAGKCNSLISNQLYSFNKTKLPTKILSNLFDNLLKKYYFYINDDIIYIELPMFEIINLYHKQTLLWKLKYHLYNIIYKLENNTRKYRINKLLYKLLSVLDYIDFKYIKKEYLTDNYKTIEEIDISNEDIEIMTDTGFKPVSHLLITKPFEIYTIELENGYKLDCADEHIVFGENMQEIYVQDLHVNDYIQTDEGLKRVTKITYNPTKICMCDTSVNDENHRFYSNGILSHNSVVTAIYCLWKILFNIDKAGLILSKSAAAGVDLLGKIKDMFLNLPYYLKPGIYKWNQHEVAFDNNSNIGTEAFSPTAGLGKTINFLILDEFAWCPNNEVELFYMNIIPTITTMPDSNVCIMSTQNGFNFFYTLWRGANEVGKAWNGYKPYKVDWYQVPNYNMEKHCWEKRTDEWKEKMIGVLGGEANFYYQYGTQFSASDKCIINRVMLQELHDNEIKFLNIPNIQKLYKEQHNLDFELGITLLHPEHLYLNPTYNFENFRNDFFVILCDLAEGGGNDYTTFNIIKIIEKDKFEQIGYWHANTVNLEQAAIEFWLLCTQLFNSDRCMYSIEWNTYGQLFYTYLINLNESDYMPEFNWRFNVAQELDTSLIVRYTMRFEVDEGGVKVKKTKRIPGIRFNSSNKVTACSLLKLLIENKRLFIYDYFTISEIENFEDKNGNGSYAASYGHDDIVMTLAQIPMLQQTAKYKEICEEINEMKLIDSSPGFYNTFDFDDSY